MNDTQDSTILLPFSQADATHLGYVGRQPGRAYRESNEWYTPNYLIETARAVMGSIDLDPFSSRAANARVNAAYYFDAQHSAFTRPWRSQTRIRQYPKGINVWMNPPYATPLVGQSVETLLKAGADGHVAQALVLVNNATETRWFHRLCEASSALCLLRGRVSFEALDGKAMSGNTRGQVVCYLPYRCDVTPTFLDEFTSLGLTIELRKVA